MGEESSHRRSTAESVTCKRPRAAQEEQEGTDFPLLCVLTDDQCSLTYVGRRQDNTVLTLSALQTQ